MITHAHIDHAGLAHMWASQGATILVSKKDVSAVKLGNEHLLLQKKFQRNDIIRYGFPEYLAENIFNNEKQSQLSWYPCALENIELPKKTYPGHTPGNLVCFISANWRVVQWRYLITYDDSYTWNALYYFAKSKGGL